MKTNYRKYVIVGPQCSGKSVLIASLIDRLIKAPKTLTTDAENWSGIRSVGLSSEILHPFPLERVLEEMSDRGSWPEATNHLSGIRWSATLGKAYKKWSHKIERDFIDIPGERFADFLGIKPQNGKNSYAAWSDSVLEHFPRNTDPASVRWYKDVREFFDGSPADASEGFVESYHQVMREATDRYRYLITPSSLISRLNSGGHNAEEFPDDFAPIPKAYRGDSCELVSQFEKSFKLYQKKVIQPLQNLIYQADVIVIPIDVGWILSSGMATLKDYQKLLESLGYYLESMHGFWKNRRAQLARWSGSDWVRDRSAGKLRKVIICGTKLDIFAPADRSRVEDLIQKMTEVLKTKANLSEIEIKYLTCSAVTCGLPKEGDSLALNGYINGKAAEMKPSRLPKVWPDRWNPGDYRFALNFDPRINGNGLYPPPNIDLKGLFDELEK